MTSSSTSLRQRLFARLMAGSDDSSFEMYRERKEQLISPLRGRVVEIGPGTGVNLQFFDADVSWVGLEPNPAMHGHIHDKARVLGLEVEIVTEPLGVDNVTDASVDAVVSTLVLCSVPSLPALLAEVLRVLKPGGTFVFLEHVVDRPWTLRRCVQKMLPFTPWRYFSDGCDPGRDIAGAIRAAGFARVDCESYKQYGEGIINLVNRPHIAGTAVK